MTTDSPERRSDTAIGSAAFKAAKEAAQSRGWVMEPSVISAMLEAAALALAAEVEAQQYLTTYNCDGTVAAHWKRHPVVPRQAFSWQPATAEEVEAAEYRCPYCASIYDGPVQCHIYDECSRSDKAARIVRGTDHG